MLVPRCPLEDADVDRPIASVHLDITRLIWEVSRLRTDAEKATYLDKFTEALALRDPAIHAFAGSLLVEAAKFIEEKSRRAREAAQVKHGNRGKTADASDSVHAHAAASEILRPSATDSQTVRQTGIQSEHSSKNPLNPPGGDALSGLGQRTVAEFTAKVVGYLNERTGRQFRVVKATERLVSTRLREGFKTQDFRTVIDKKCRQWLGDEQMQEYLRPATLFGTKFESYLNQDAVAAAAPPAVNGRPHAHAVQPDFAWEADGGADGPA